MEPVVVFAATLYWLAHAGTFKTAAHGFAIAKQTDSKHARRVIQALFEHWVPEMIVIPEGDEVLRVMDDFRQFCGLPQVVGAIDGTYLKMLKRPSVDFADRYWCYKNFYGILILAVVDSVGRFIFIDSGRAASVGDAAAYQLSEFKKWIKDRDIFGIEFDAELEYGDGDSMIMQPIILADTAYPLSTYVIKCFPNPSNRAQRRFNDAVIAGRKQVEMAFGRCKERWRIMYGTNVTKPDYLAQIAAVCCALHNYCENARLANQFDGLPDIVPGVADLLGNVGVAPEDSETISGEFVRDCLCDWYDASTDR